MELVLEIWSEPWTPPPFNLAVDVWIILGRPQLPWWLQQPSALASDAARLAAKERRRERARVAMERVRKIVLKEMDTANPLVSC